LRSLLDFKLESFDGGFEVAFVLRHGKNFAALDAFDQHLDVAIRLFQALHNVRDRAYGKDLVGAGLVHASRRVASRENLLSPASASSSARTSTRAYHEGRHHVGEDHDVPDGHHRQPASVGFFFGGNHVMKGLRSTSGGIHHAEANPQTAYRLNQLFRAESR
jgi:hypothetical protein